MIRHAEENWPLHHYRCPAGSYGSHRSVGCCRASNAAHVGAASHRALGGSGSPGASRRAERRMSDKFARLLDAAEAGSFGDVYSLFALIDSCIALERTRVAQV